MVASSQVVNAYASSTAKARRARWDFEEESPLRDARGFDMARQIADPSQLTDEDLGLANIILTNGARLYVDHAHPEYSTPEVTSPLDIVLWDKAGEQVMLDAQRLAAQLPGRVADPALQEQHRQQGRLLRHPRELPDARAPPRSPTSSATSRRSSSAARSCAARVGSGSARTAANTASRSASAPTTSRSRSGSRPP